MFSQLGSAEGASSFRRFLGAEEGRIYAVDSVGDLRFFQHFPETAQPIWANATGSTLGAGWHPFVHLAYNGNGVFYAVGSDGRLSYYRDRARNGEVDWANGGAGVVISLSTNWAEYRWLLGDGDGILYGITHDGELYFHRHLSQDESPVWANEGRPQLLGHGWKDYRRVIAGRDGILYAITQEGDLYYFRDRAPDGTSGWQTPGLLLASGWNRFVHVFSTGHGNLYGIDCLGDIYFHQVAVTNGSVNWAVAGARIGDGFYTLPPEGYCWPLSGGPGQTLQFHLSGNGPIDVTFLRHTSDAVDVLSRPMGRATFFAPWRATPADAVARGCDWPVAGSLTIPGDWPSGLYSARCGLDDDCGSQITFVVNPAPSSSSKVAVLANINTWLAYNAWGGGSKYLGRHARVSFLRPAPDTSPVNGEGAGLHLTRAELWILGWLENAGHSPDLFTDLDFHNGLLEGRGYRCLIVGTHPEYWTLPMYDGLVRFLERGGSLLYLGGNGLYEVGAYADDQTAMIFRDGVEGGPRESALFRNLSPPRPERAVLGVATERCGVFGAPYQLQTASHPFFRGTALTNGAIVGEFGLNTVWATGAAAGFEVDTSAGIGALGIPTDCNETSPAIPPGPGLPPGHQILATATNWFKDGRWHGAEMTYYPHQGGGFVFSVGSITFGGSLIIDPVLQQIVGNALNEALMEVPRLTLVYPAPAAGEPGVVECRLRGRPGATYELQYTAALASSWSALTNLALDEQIEKRLPLRLRSAQGFFRVRQLP